MSVNNVKYLIGHDTAAGGDYTAKVFYRGADIIGLELLLLTTELTYFTFTNYYERNKTTTD